jgi:hypothetical protein
MEATSKPLMQTGTLAGIPEVQHLLNPHTNKWTRGIVVERRELVVYQVPYMYLTRATVPLYWPNPGIRKHLWRNTS